MNEFDKSFTGGARVGWMNASMPMAKLVVSREELQLKIWILGRYLFRPDQVVSIRRYSRIPILASGVAIEHNIPEYPERMIFWTMKPDAVLRAVEESGFKASASPASVQRHKGFAVRWQAIVFAALVWNFLLLTDFAFGTQPYKGPGPFSLVALGLFFVGSALFRWNAAFQRLVLKPNRSPGEIMGATNLSMLILGFMFVIFTVILVAMTVSQK